MKFFKQIIGTAALILIMQSAAYAQTVDTIAADTSGAWETQVTVSENGYYDITAECRNNSVDGSCYLYGKSHTAEEASTVVPLSSDYSEVIVRGIYVDDGKLDIGMYTDGTNSVYVKNVNVEKSTKTAPFINGGDITEYSYIKDLGGKYYDEQNNEADAIEYLAQNGMNTARIRLSNNPGKGHGDGTYYLPQGYQDEEDCLKLAKKAKENGMETVFTFNYSDYWSNGTRQRIPSKWVQQVKDELGYDIENAEFLNAMTSAERTQIKNKLSDIIYKYTYDYMLRLKEQGTAPKYVSLGNEINGGILFPFGNTYAANMNKDSFELQFDNNTSSSDILCPKDWAGIAQMLNAGYDAVKAVSPDTEVIIHLADGSKTSTYTWFFDDFIKAGGKVDIIGASYYPSWSNNVVSTCVSFCDAISDKYNRDIMIMETGFNFAPTRKDGYAGQLSNIDAYKNIYPDSQSGHKGYMAELINGMKRTKRCLGILYWDPIMIHVEDRKGNSISGWAYRESDDGVEPNVVENTTLFDFNGKVTKTIGVYRDSKNSTVKTTAPIQIENRAVNGNKVTYSLKTASDKNGMAVAVVYDNDGRMYSADNAVTVNNSVQLEVNIPDNTANVKIMLWEDMNSINPVTEVIDDNFVK